MDRFLVNISFKGFPLETLVGTVKTRKEAESYITVIDDTVAKALYIDNVTDKITWLKK